MGKVVSSVMVFAIRAYQVVLSPLFTGCCRFRPTCSNYAIEAIRTHGAARGFMLTCARLMRCRPFGPHGYDPVPETGKWREGLWLSGRGRLQAGTEKDKNS